MSPRKLRKTILIILLGIILFFIGYSAVFRTYVDTDAYLQLAWEYTGRDPHILNWQEPEVEVIWRDGTLLVHLTYHTDEDDLHGPWSLYINPFKKQVVDEDPRK